MQLPGDIENKIDQEYPARPQNARAKELITGLWSDSLNVGPDQLARAMLVLADGDLERLATLKKDYMGDPRDVIMNAEAKAGFPGHYFTDPFKD